MTTTTPAQKAAPTTMHFVVKTSKYCNLRCTYCYEFAFLDDRRRMSLDELEVMFRTVSVYAEAHGVRNVGFTWHGGEPFVIPMKVYDEIGALQRRALANVAVTNRVQTNLTVLTDRHIEFLKSGGLFDSIGISFDVSGNKRVDKHGRATTSTVLSHMQHLLDAELPFAAICVLARSNSQDTAQLFKFFADLNLNCRFLPFYRDTNSTGDRSEALSQREIVAGLIAVFDAWIQSESAITVEPLRELVEVAQRYIEGGRPCIYDKSTEEWTYVINPNGDLWGISEIEDNRHLYGNIFQTSLADILSSDVRHSTFAPASRRIDRVCGSCPYLGYCSGYFVADATDSTVATLEREGCHIRAILDHVVCRLEEFGLADAIRRTRIGVGGEES